MNIQKYKAELEKGIYEVNGVFYIGGKIVERVLRDAVKESIKTSKTCDVCGSSDIIEVPHMGRNCNCCNPLF
jgi:hypothetical protein